MEDAKDIAREHARASSTDGRGDAARSDAARIVIPVLGSTLTIAVALAALILTSAHNTRQQLNEKLELMHRHFTEQNELMRGHSDLQFGQLREDLRDVRGDVRDVRGDVREVRGDVRALAERVAKLEGLLLAGLPPGLVPPAATMGADSSAGRAEDTRADQGRSP